MQISNPIVCDMSKGNLYKSNKTTLVGKHAFSLTECVGWSAHVTLSGSVEIMSAATSELPYPCISQVKFQNETPRRRK